MWSNQSLPFQLIFYFFPASCPICCMILIIHRTKYAMSCFHLTVLLLHNFFFWNVISYLATFERPPPISSLPRPASSNQHLQHSLFSHHDTFFFFLFYFIFKLNITVLDLPNIKMNPPQVYMCSPSWTLLPPPSPFHPSGSSQCTSPKHPVSYLNFKWIKCSNQKTQTGWMNTKTRPINMLSTRNPLQT